MKSVIANEMKQSRNKIKLLLFVLLVAFNILLLFQIPNKYKNYNITIRSIELLKQYETIEKIQKEIPTPNRLTELVAELPSLIRKHGLKLSSIRYEPLTNVAGHYLRLTINLPLEGSYLNLRQFIFSLERKSWLAIESLTLKKGKGTDEVSASLQLATYIRGN